MIDLEFMSSFVIGFHMVGPQSSTPKASKPIDPGKTYTSPECNRRSGGERREYGFDITKSKERFGPHLEYRGSLKHRRTGPKDRRIN